MLLSDDETLLSSVEVPFRVRAPRPSTRELVSVMTEDFTQMPASSEPVDDEAAVDAGNTRQALLMATFAYDEFPEIATLIVRRLAQEQGGIDRSDMGRYADREEPGRIPHSIRSLHDPVAAELTKQYGWQWPYFGSVDSTPLFISLAARIGLENPDFFHEQVQQRDGIMRSISEAVQNAVGWLERRMQQSLAGMLETKMASNDCWLTWTDSGDAYHHLDGSLATGRVAPIEVQGFAYDALIDASALAKRGLILGDPNMLWTRAQRLRRSVIENAWVVDPRNGSFFAMGMERTATDFRPLAVRSANMGFLLTSRMLDGVANDRYVNQIVQQLFDAGSLWSINGIRSLAANEKRYRPFALHNGSIWMWQNLWIARGLRHHEFEDLAMRVESNVRRVCDSLDCYPEFVQGGNDPIPHVNESLMEVRAPDGLGGAFEYRAIVPPQSLYGLTIFGIHELLNRISYTNL